jgi:predicted RecB family nuclease
MADKVGDIRGMDAGAQQKMAQMGINTTDQLLEHARTPQQRNALAKELGVAGSQLTEWVNRADLMRLKGVGKEMANLLEECGVDSVKELQHRRAENLQAALKAANDEKKITHHAPTLAQVQQWIEESKSLSTTVS